MLRSYAPSVALALLLCAPAIAQTAVFTAHPEKKCVPSRHSCGERSVLVVSGVKGAAVSDFVIAGTGVGGPLRQTGRLRRP